MPRWPPWLTTGMVVAEREVTLGPLLGVYARTDNRPSLYIPPYLL